MYKVAQIINLHDTDLSMKRGEPQYSIPRLIEDRHSDGLVVELFGCQFPLHRFSSHASFFRPGLFDLESDDHKSINSITKPFTSARTPYFAVCVG